METNKIYMYYGLYYPVSVAFGTILKLKLV